MALTNHEFRIAPRARFPRIQRWLNSYGSPIVSLCDRENYKGRGVYPALIAKLISHANAERV